jgi:peptidoglycan-N-acetylglucosamine deacetylase
VSDDRLRVALTLDAEHPSRPPGPPDNVERILDTLAGAGVRATFFVQGRWASAYPNSARRIAADGHLVGNHSHYHARLPLLSDEGLRADVLEAEARIAATAGVDPKPWFRCPFGAGHDDARVVSVVEALGYHSVFWDVQLDDWEPRSAKDITLDALKGVESHGDGAVVLMHTWPEHMAGALPAIVSKLSESGAQFVGVDELETTP